MLHNLSLGICETKNLGPTVVTKISGGATLYEVTTLSDAAGTRSGTLEDGEDGI